MCKNIIKNDVQLISSDYYAYLYLILCNLKKESLCLEKDSRFSRFSYWNLVKYTNECYSNMIKNGNKTISRYMPYFSKVFNNDMSLKTQ